MEVDLDLLSTSHYDAANPLVLPSKRVKQPKVSSKQGKAKVLSKKQRKKLQKIVERRAKKGQRADLLSELEHLQLPAQVYKGLSHLVTVQTSGVKKLLAENARGYLPALTNAGKEEIVQTSRKKGKGFLTKSQRHTILMNPNTDVLGFETDSGLSESDVSEDEVEMPVPMPVVVILPEPEPIPLVEVEVVSVDEDPKKIEIKKKKPVLITPAPKKPTFVPVNRKASIEKTRQKLPILAEEQAIMEAIHDHKVTVLAGETGSGKTTQIPQFLYESGYTANGKLIGVTEPRRVAAISMSARVGTELGSKQLVSYQIRYEGNVSKRTQIKFMTDGVLLKEMERDFTLTKYSVIIIDEAHERSLYTDILIGLLSRAVNVREKRGDPLKLVIMSATMRVEDFKDNTHLFKTPPAFIHVPTRQFPVQIHFSKLTPVDYLGAAQRKVIQIHRKLPAGGILVFVTGQQEVRTLMEALQSEVLTIEANEEPEPGLTEYDLDNLDGKDDELGIGLGSNKLHIVPLYSMLPIRDQKLIFTPPPEGTRLVVVATNVAETSITIPSIRYVVDTGKVKVKKWDKITGVQTFQVEWTSKASAEQRSGRAGRTGPGHAYRLFSSAVFSHDFPEYSEPEIRTRPVDDMVLLMKSMGITNVTNFPYPTHPGEDQLKAGERLLTMLGALEVGKGSTPTITSLGKTMAHLPLSPRFGKMIAISFPHGVAEFVVTLVAGLTVQEVLLDVPTNSDKESRRKWINQRRKWAGSGSSLLLGDMMVLLRSIGAFEYDGGSPETCNNLGLRHKAMLEIRQLRKQLTSDINLISGIELLLNPQMRPPTETQSDTLRQIILSGSPDRVARLITEEVPDVKKYKGAYWCGELADPTYLHQSSVLRAALPRWIVYQEAFETNEKIYLRGITAIDPAWIPLVVPSQCHFGPPLESPAPYYDPLTGLLQCSVKATYGKQAWELPTTVIEYPVSLNKYKLLAQCFLSGELFPVMGQWKEQLLSLPTIMTKSWARLRPRTQTMLQAISGKAIQRKGDFLEIWEAEPKFLLKEYLEWVPVTLQTEVRSRWPPM